MILWLDLGNTRLKYWLMDNGVPVLADAKEHLKAPNELLLGLLQSFRQYPIEFVGISSVLGEKINAQLTDTLTQVGMPFEFAKVNANHPLLKSNYDPNQLGVDRWLQMLGLVGNACQQCVVGAGTALTIDLIDDGVHLGGYILPNVYMQRHALYAGTHQIAVKAGRFDSTKLGTTTFDAVNHGVLFGIISAITNIQQTYPDFQMTLTGGGSVILLPHLADVAVDEDLLLKGLIRYFEKVC